MNLEQYRLFLRSTRVFELYAIIGNRNHEGKDID